MAPTRKAARQCSRSLLRHRAMGKPMDGLIAWSGMILDRLMESAPDECEAAVAETAIELVLPLVAIRPAATLSDNDA